MLSELDIKKALVDFDNFNISLEETDVLFEFLAIRAAQTGKNIDELQSSLVEGLSKESKLRIDNLGIATADLNSELKKTPNFVEAVANIAKREVAEAGAILDDAGNSQEKWNSALNDFQLALGNGVIAKASNSLYDFGTNIIRAITPSKELNNTIKEEQSELNNLVGSILKTNEKEEDRKVLLDQLIEKYPFFLKFVDDETLSNNELKKALSEVNGLYIKRLALQRLQEKLELGSKQAKLADETIDLTKVERDYQKVLTKTNLFVNRNVLNTNLASESTERQNKLLKKTIESEIIRLSQLRGQGKATQTQVKNLFKYEKALFSLASATKVFQNANSQFSFAENAVEQVNKEVKELEEALGLTSKELESLFNNDENAVLITVNLDPEARKKALQEARELRQKIAEFEIKEQIKRLDRIIDNEENANYQIVEALRERMLLQIDLEESISDFAIKNNKLKGDALLLAEKELQSKLTDIVIKGQADMKKARQRDESDKTPLGEDDGLDGIDTKLFLIGALVEAGEGTFKELSKMYDDDLEAFLKLAQEKLGITIRYSNAQKRAIEESFNGFGDLYGIDASMFLKLFEEKKLTTQDYVDIAGEAITGLYNSFLHNYEEDLRLAREKADSALVFANGGAEAEAKIREDLAKREAQIRQKQAKQDKDQALFNIFINTARGVTAALTSTPPNIPLSIAVGAIGLASAVKVASREIPQFKHGVTDFEGGLAIVGDGGKSEVIRTPDGQTFKTPSTDTIVNLPKHSDVFSSEDEFFKDLHRLTDINNIMFDPQLFQIPDLAPSININNSGASAQEIDSIMGKHFSKHFSNIQTNQTIIDKNGIRTLISKGNSATIIHNNRTSFKGFSV